MMSDTVDSEEKQVNNRLAVFEQLQCKEKKWSSKNLTNKRENLKRSLSPSSDTELVIDDEDYSCPKRRNKAIRLLEEPLKLVCNWKECVTVFNDYRNFIYHIIEHIPEADDESEDLKCEWEECVYVATNLSLLQQHACFHGYHAKLKNIGNNALERIKLPKCNQPNAFLIPLSLNGFDCDWSDCGACFPNVYEYHEHMRLHINSNPKRGELIPCLWRGCTYKFSTQYKLMDHIRSHTKERVIACPTCGGTFATKTKFYDHRKRQLPIDMQSYQCSQCSKLFPTERLLRDHMRSHINHYKCTMCDMTCPKPSALATHIRNRHLEDRPLKCHYCEHSCVTKQSLELHLMTHWPGKLYSCEECDYRCRSLPTLDRHYHRVHEQGWSQTYECHCCQKRFPIGNKLTKHLMKQHNFYWPSGHSRFRYKEDTDGIYRLQTVRYESIEVTQEMIRKNNDQQLPKVGSNMLTYQLKKTEEVPNKPPNYVLMVTENGDQNVAYPTNNSIVMTINDVDESGNIVNSEILQSNEMKIVDSNSAVKEPKRLRPRRKKK